MEVWKQASVALEAGAKALLELLVARRRTVRKATREVSNVILLIACVCMLGSFALDGKEKYGTQCISHDK